MADGAQRPNPPPPKLTQEKWLATNFIFDKQAIEITLSSAIDAVEAAIPEAVSTQNMVGNIPVTGTHQTDDALRPNWSPLPPRRHPRINTTPDCLEQARTNLNSGFPTQPIERGWYRRLYRGDYTVFNQLKR